ncbi:hypothetical protein BKA61DRAFT_575435 [Leptodontidium sp. MPI-SDFR-AT-0119]|nr:hypothetical protein BKA61DRAFT_575435 [Leptodontidium sp. MPI-SDFR-AT-0119]
MARLLLAEGANANGTPQTQVRGDYKIPLQLAIEREHVALVSVLTSYEADPRSSDNWEVVWEELRMKVETMKAKAVYPYNWKLERCKIALKMVEDWLTEPEDQVLSDEESNLYGR